MVLFSGLIILIFVMIITHINAIISFREERDYIKMEISRSLDEHKHQYWKRELKKLYLKSIPIIGRFIK